MFEKLFGRKKEEKTSLPENKEIQTSGSDKQEVIEDKSHTTIDLSKKAENIPSAASDVRSSIDVPEKNKENSPPSAVTEEKKIEIPPLTEKEFKALKNSRYEQTIMNNPRFKKAYVLLNRKTKQIVEIRAASSFHACNIIGWKANKVVVLQETDIPDSQPETVGSSRAG